MGTLQIPEILAVIDCETGGLDPKTDALFSVGLVIVNTRLDTVIKAQEWLISPHKDLKVCERALRVQGLTWADVAHLYVEGQDEEEAAVGIAETMSRYLGEAGEWRQRLFAYNAPFDSGFLGALMRRTIPGVAAERYGCHGWRDARELYLLLQTLGYCPPGDAHLKDAAAVLCPDHPRPEKHEALADAMLTAKVVHEALKVLTRAAPAPEGKRLPQMGETWVSLTSGRKYKVVGISDDLTTPYTIQWIDGPSPRSWEKCTLASVQNDRPVAEG